MFGLFSGETRAHRVSLARAMLRYEHRRYRSAVFALAFAGLLIITQLGVMVAIFDDVGALVHQSEADLWATSPGIKSVENSRAMPERNAVYFWQNPAVTDVDAIFSFGSTWRKGDGSTVSAYAVGISAEADRLGLAKMVTPELRQKLAQPGAVLVERGDLRKLGVAVGDFAELGGKRVQVVGTMSGLRSMGGSYIVMSTSTARLIDSNKAMSEHAASYFLAKLQPGTDARAAAAQLDADSPGGRFKTWPAQTLISQSVMYWINTSGVGAGIAFNGVLALIIGLVITNQTLRAAILAVSRECATVRALGLSPWTLVRVIVEQSFWLGLIGMAAAAVATYGISLAAGAMRVPMALPLWACISTAAFILFTALVSGLMSARTVFRIDPAELLR